MKPATFRLLPFAALAASALPLCAQAPVKKPASPAARPATSATRRPGAATTAKSATSAATTCAVPTADLSPKIPALAVATKCPKSLYTVTYTLGYVDTQIGTGEIAKPQKWYTVHYTGYLPDGTKFDSSVDRKDPISFPYGAHRVIPGWDTGFDGMHVGGKRRLYIPYQLAYGEQGRPPVIPAKAELIFDVELISQSDTPPAPKTPATPPTPPPAQPGSSAPGDAAKPAGAPGQPATSPAGAGAPPPTNSSTPSSSTAPTTGTAPKPQ